MKLKNTQICILLSLIFTGCASDPIDPLNPNQGAKADLRPQCPIGQEPIYSTEIVIKTTDKDKKTGQTRQTFKCELIK